jgi:hypothetical protein
MACSAAGSGRSPTSSMRRPHRHRTTRHDGH